MQSKGGWLSEMFGIALEPLEMLNGLALCCFQPFPERYESFKYFNLRNEGIYQYVSQSNPCGKMTLLPTKHLGIVIIQKFDIP